MLAAVPYRLTAESDLLTRVQWQRFFSLVMSSGVVVFAYLIARALFPNDYGLRLTIPILVAFQPMMTQMTAVVTVDGFYFLCYTVLIWLSILVLRDGLDWRYGLAIGVAFAAALLTKPTVNGYAPLLAGLIAYDWWRGRGRRRNIAAGTAAMVLVLLLPTAWWMQRSLRINNDLFYFNPVLEGHRIITDPYFDYTPLSHMVDYYQSVWGGVFVTWWGHFGWVDTPLPPVTYDFLRWLIGISAAVLLISLLMHWQSRPTLAGWRSGRSTAPLAVWVFLLLTSLIPIVLIQFYDLTFWWEYGNGRGLQGRYWLGTIVPMLTFLALGLVIWIPRRWQGPAHSALRAGMMLLNAVSLLWYVLPRYYL
jgi:4-amino-4-deoxy-L-arabinose transferase-like glycosyltransferase